MKRLGVLLLSAVIWQVLAHRLEQSYDETTLGLSPETVANNVSDVFSKLLVTGQVKLMLMTLEAGLSKQGTASEP